MFPRQNPLHVNLLPHTRSMPCLSKLPRFDCPNMTDTNYKDISTVVIRLNFPGNIWETTLLFSNSVVTSLFCWRRKTPRDKKVVSSKDHWRHLWALLTFYVVLISTCGPGRVVGIATAYGLDGLGTESRWGIRFSAPVQIGPGAHPASCTMGTGSFPGVKSGRGVTLTPHPLIVPWSRKRRAIPLLPLWAVRPAQSLSACTRVHFIFTL